MRHPRAERAQTSMGVQLGCALADRVAGCHSGSLDAHAWPDVARRLWPHGVRPTAQLESNEVPYVSAVYGMSDLVMKRILYPLLLSDTIFNLTKYGLRWRRDLAVLIGTGIARVHAFPPAKADASSWT